MKKFEDHDIRLTTDYLINGCQATSVYKWQARCIKAKAKYNACSTVLQVLQLVKSIYNEILEVNKVPVKQNRTKDPSTNRVMILNI